MVFSISLSKKSEFQMMMKHPRLPLLSPPAFAILLALRDGEKHGYAILREVNETTQGTVRLLPGTLYNLVRRMLEDRWIEESDQRPDPQIDDERRRYYRLTALGQQVVSHEAERLAQMVNLARQRGLLSYFSDAP
jgi:DNA-binding PadR family transcriptional regulator